VKAKCHEKLFLFLLTVIIVIDWFCFYLFIF